MKREKEKCQEKKNYSGNKVDELSLSGSREEIILENYLDILFSREKISQPSSWFNIEYEKGSIGKYFLQPPRNRNWKMDPKNFLDE